MAAPALKTEYSGVVERCRDTLKQALGKRVDTMFERLDDAFYKLADKADSNAQQAFYFDAMREVRKQRQVIAQGVAGKIEADFKQFWQKGPVSFDAIDSQKDTPEETDDGLELLGEGQLEEDLAVSSMISKGNNTFYRDLYALEQRFSVMLGGAKVDSSANPLSPTQFGEAIKWAIAALEMDITVKLVVYKQFEREVIDRLGDVYDQVNDLMAKAGVLPKLKRAVSRQRDSRPSVPQASTVAGSENQDYAHQVSESSSVDAEIFSTLQQLLVQRRGDGLEHTNQTAMPMVAVPELLSLLSGLQLTNAHAGGQPAQYDEEAVRNIKDVLAADGVLAERRINQADEDVIDVISMLFEFILEDPSLPDAMRALLARLQIPMLKVAILDKTFFSRTEHPARRLLNSLAQAAVGWSGAMGRESSGLYGRIEAIVYRILNDFNDDVSLFDELNQNFSAYLANEQKGAGIAEKRATQVTEGKERLGGAKDEVATAIQSALSSSLESIPEVVGDLLQEGWKGVLLTVLLREGEESQAWTDAVATMEQLVWSVLPKQDAKERQLLLKAIPQLLKNLRTGLNDIAYDQHKMASLFKALQKCHVQCLRTIPSPVRPSQKAVDKQEVPESQVGFSLDEERGADDVEEIVLETPSLASKEADEPVDRYTMIAEQLERGTWVERTDDEGQVVRSKLSWRSGITGVCLFVNRKGIKVAEVSPQALASWFRSGKVVVLEGAGVPLMDRALSAMVNVLNQEAAETK